VQKGGSGATKARLQNGRVPAGTSAAAAAAGPRVKKPGVLSQSASFPARGAVAVAAKKAAAAVATPKQAKGAVPIGSETAAGQAAGMGSFHYLVMGVLTPQSVVPRWCRVD
jgi:hypothetical protein